MPKHSNSVKLLAGIKPRPQISHVLFDFDGTLSWIRHGWPRMMAEVMRQYYPARTDETEEGIFDHLITELLSLNGKPTIFQMDHFKKEVESRGGKCPPAEELRKEYQDRLDHVIEERAQAIRKGVKKADDFVVFGARELLTLLHERGLKLIILSSTVVHRVREEAAILEIEPFFGPFIYGGGADGVKFSKREVIDRFMREDGISGAQLLSFGDGPVEIVETVDVGGLAIAVASNEEKNGSGIMDPWKRRQLAEAGAHGMIPDYRNAAKLISEIFGK